MEADMEAINEQRQRLCLLCATITTHPNYVDIFIVDGLSHKIETCLPIQVRKSSELPDMLCLQCTDAIDAFYEFRRRSLETLAILEEKYQTNRSCFISRHKSPSINDKSTITDNLQAELTQFEEWKMKKLGQFHLEADSSATIQKSQQTIRDCALEISKAEELLSTTAIYTNKLVDYDSDDLADVEQNAKATTSFTNIRNKLYFDDSVNDIISEIVERKSTKRKLDVVVECDLQLMHKPKMFKLNETIQSLNRRKTRQPIKRRHLITSSQNSMISKQTQRADVVNLPQVCLLCDQQFAKGSALARHVFDTHGIDMAQVLSNEPVPEVIQRSLQVASALQTSNGLQLDDFDAKSPKSSPEKKAAKKLPELVKITDLKTKRESIETKHVENDAPPTLTASYVCPLCPASLTNKCDLYAHLRLRHSQHAKLICGLCLHIASSLGSLQEHVDICVKSHPTLGYFICQLCKYSDDNQKSLENHILVHDFLLGECKKDGKIFDPADYIETNILCDAKTYSCTECQTVLMNFKDFSSHRRSEHSIFHCDLCNKSYGRNSHLWKHVNRVHKGHPSVTCQFCYRTSASKYHLMQHFNKIHTQKSTSGAGGGGASGKVRNGDLNLFTTTPGDSDEDFMSKRFEGFDFQSVRQKFMRQELQGKDKAVQRRVEVIKDDKFTNVEDSVPPKELDSSSTIYTNIITNYTPPSNDGEFKCPKCSKAFHKRTLLKKHKKNCRPRLQKDLLTRCKSCSRIFKDRQSLAKHLVNYHSEYSCEMCAEKVQSKCEIVSHIRFTHPESRLVCVECGNVLRNNDLLRAHLADHNNSFVCQFCGDILPSKIKLKMHILSLHRKILSLSCGVCLKLFENQHILRDHVRLVHKEALQPLTSCTVCGKNYGSKWKTYDHLNKSHGRVFRACKSCLEVFNNEQELQIHFDIMHAKGVNKKVVTGSESVLPEKEPPIQVQIKEIIVEQNGPAAAAEQDEVQEESRSSHDSDGESSILEKHLRQQQQQQQPPPISRNNNASKINGGPAPVVPKTPKTTNKPPLSMSLPATPSVDTDALINSSKRTVYVNSNDPSVCDICHKNWPAKKHLWQHYIRCHKDVAATVCGICLCTNESYEELQRHLHREHPTLLHGKGFGSNFICRICGRYHNASSKLRLHMAIHTKFDWGLLEEQRNGPVVKEEVEDGEQHEEDDEEEDEHDGRKLIEDMKCEEGIDDDETVEEEVVDGEVNYESLIEQVECSTNSSSSSSESEEEDDDDEEEEDEEVVVKEGEEEEVEVKTEEICMNEGILEQELEVVGEEYEEVVYEQEEDVEMYEEVEEEVVQMQQDDEEIIDEIIIKQVEVEQEEDDDDSAEYEEDQEVEAEGVYEEEEEEAEQDHDDDEDDDDEDEEDEESPQSDETNTTEADGDGERDDEEAANNLEMSYVQDADVVDSAVKSICYDVDSCHRNDSPQEYEVQSHNNLNQHEIQSAVDSIL